MDISNRFSLVDFFAYLFPGFVGTLGLYVLLLLTPLNHALTRLPADLTTGILFIMVSFILGVVFSGFSEIVFKARWEAESFGSLNSSPLVKTKVRIPFLRRKARDRDSKLSLPLPSFQQEIDLAFRDVFKLHPAQRNESSPERVINWSAENFYICRSLIFEKMPNCSQQIQRQSGLRQLRMNLILPVLIWFVAGIAWGRHQIVHNDIFWGQLLIIGSFVIGITTILMIVNRMKSNQRRETREVLSAFLAGYKAGIFDKTDKNQ